MAQTPTTYGLPKKRTQVIEALKSAYANQNLEDQEYERRLTEATNAKSIEELELVLFDFPPAVRYKVFPKTPSGSQVSPATSMPPALSLPKMQVILGNEEKNMPEFSNALPKISAILSSQKLDFRLSKVPETPINIQIECILSSTTIDLRNDNLDGKHVNLYISGGLGEVKILLPPGTQIQRNIQMIGGECKIQNKKRSWIKKLTGMGNQEPEPEIQLSVQVIGTYWLGEVKLIY